MFSHLILMEIYVRQGSAIVTAPISCILPLKALNELDTISDGKGIHCEYTAIHFPFLQKKLLFGMLNAKSQVPSTR